MVFDPWNSRHKEAQLAEMIFEVFKMSWPILCSIPWVLALMVFKHWKMIELLSYWWFWNNITYEPMNWMNPSFWLSYGLLDIDLMLMNSYVVLCGLLIDVTIVVNWYLGFVRFMNLYWFDLVHRLLLCLCWIFSYGLG